MAVPRTLHGFVRHTDGAPIPDVRVQAVRLGIGGEEVLASTTTKPNGAYEFLDQAATEACVFIRVVAGDDRVVAASPPAGRSGASHVDVYVRDDRYRGPSDFQRVHQRIAPFLEDRNLAELDARSVGFLVRSTGLHRKQIAPYLLARRQALATSVSAEALYGLIRTGGARAVGRLLNAKETSIVRRLENAGAANIISLAAGASGRAVYRQLRASLSDQATRASSGFASLLRTTALNDSQRNAVVTRHFAHTADVPTYWAQLRGDPSFGDEACTDLQFSLQLGVLTANHSPLIGALRSDPRLGRARDLVAFSEGDWLAHIRSRREEIVVGVPASIPGETQADREAAYARRLVQDVERAWPTAFVAARMRGDDFPGKDLILPFLLANEGFDFARTSIQTWFNSTDAVLPAAGVDELRALVARHQRLFRIAPSTSRWTCMRALDAAGLASSRDVVRTGKRAFVARFASQVGGELEARAIYERAAARTASAVNLLANLGAAYQGPAIQSLPDVGDAVSQLDEASNGLPEWRSLFGSLDFCACSQCRSILSPAAYLTDLLHWLEDEGALGALRKRRPDLFALKLSCDNTNIVLPYVDTVIEVLENRVADRAHVAAIQAEEHTESTLPSDVLLACPEFLNQEVYDLVLAKAVYPFVLPFDLTALQGRVYLEQQGVQRPELMEAFRPIPASGSHRDVAIASERLGLTSLERRLVTGLAGHTQPVLWGYAKHDEVWTETLARAQEFLDRSGLSFPELLDLLHVSWVNPKAKQRWVTPEGESDCDLTQMVLRAANGEVPGEDFYDRARRFIRLWRKFDISIIDFDKLLIALNVQTIDDTLIERLSDIQRIRSAVSIDLIALLSLWSDVDMKLDRPGRDVPIVPLYDRVFLDRAVMSDEATWPFALNEHRALVFFGDALSTWTVELQAALGVTAEELDALLEPDMSLSIPTLSRLYRSVVLATALKISVADLLIFRDLFAQLPEPIDPFVAADGGFDTRATLRFIEEVRAVADAGFNASDLLYLLGHDADAALSVGPAVTTQAVFLSELRSGLQAVEAETLVEPDPTGEITQRLLSEIVDAADLDAVLALIAGEVPADPAEAERLYAYLAMFMSDIDPRTVNWTGFPTAERFAFVLDRLVPFLATVRKERLVQEKVASLLGLEPNQSDALLVLAPLSVLSLSTAAGAANLLGVLLTSTFIHAEVLETPDDHPAAFATITLLDKIATLFGALGVRIDEQTWLLAHGPSAGMLDPATLPLSPADASALYPQWRALREALRVRDVLPGATPTVIELLTAANDAAIDRDTLLGQLRDRTGWSFEPAPDVYSDLRWLADELGLREPRAFHDGTALHALAGAFAVLGKVGVTAQQASAWGAADLTPAAASAIALAAKADYSPTRWYEVARPLRNKLREGQRAALVAWLVHDTPNISDASELFADVLLDVEMDPCMLTSRIVQAIGSVQLYVQRCFLNLEAAKLGPDADERWTWMKNYRVWEANRRVFLYPENWLRPELRDDKSELFQALETELLQAPITDMTAEQAYLNYLQGMLQISRLEIVAHYHEVDEDAEASLDVLHVFGRTPALPRAYFYRRREAGRWSPWTKVDLDIEGDHLIPVVHNRRLMVFWPIFLEQSVDDTNSEGAPPQKFLTVQLAYSECRAGAWSPKQVSEQEIDTSTAFTGNDPSWLKFAFEFRTREQAGMLEIECFYSQALTWSCGKFTFDDCTGAVRAVTDARSDTVVYPDFARPAYSRMSSSWWLYNPGAWFSVGPIDDGDTSRDLVADESAESLMVLETPLTNTFYTVARQDNEFVSQRPFFYFDDERTFLVEPSQGWSDNRFSQLFETDAIALDAPGKTGNGAFYSELDADDFQNVGDVLLFDTASDAVASLDRVVSNGNKGESSLTNLRLATTAPGPITNLGALPRVASHGISIGPQASVQPTSGDPFAQTAEGIQQAAAYDAAQAYNTAALLEVAGTLTAYDHVAAGVLGDPEWTYTFSPHYHPFACRFVREVQRYGVEGLLAPADEDSKKSEHTLARQQLLHSDVFAKTYRPVESVVREPLPVENIEFGDSGAYSLYNWELFFHIPLLIADRLRREGRFDEARRWFQFIFDPTNRNPAYDPPYRYWKVKPFTSEVGETIPALLTALASDDSSPDAMELRADVEAQIAAYIADPFNPWAIARLRTTAYQKTVVIQYVQLLLESGDTLFRQDTMESVNEATQLYLMAGALLGDRPQEIPARDEVEPKSWDELKADGLDAFSNAAVEIENALYAQRPVSGAEPPEVYLGTTLYFCVPHNENLITLWDTVEDRLYKLRHCMNIDGVVRHLPLFQPPIDPGLLVSAAASGGSLASAVAGLQVALPYYRFRVMLQRAQALAGNVRALGSTLLAALEKRDSEALQQLRTGNEVALLDAVRDVRAQQVDEAKASLAALESSKAVAQARATHYATLVQDGLSEEEQQQIKQIKAANTFTSLQQISRLLQSCLAWVPDADAGASGMASPVVKFRFGGSNLQNNVNGAADALGSLATFYSQKASLHGLNAGNDRRAQDWELQASLAAKDVESISKQIEAAQVRQQIAERELKNHDLQREQARAVDQWMRGKYTSDQLYDWFVSQLSAVHSQSYALAYDVARQAERCYQHELARYDAAFVQSGSYDSLHKGLLSGERLGLDLDRMEISYLQYDKRELELTKSISLARIDPVALVALRESGSCTLQLDEVLFDLDVPGLYMRRIKSVSVTVPAVVGAMTSLNLKLTLMQSSTRLTPAVDDPANPGSSYRRSDGEDSRFRDEIGAAESIVTSSGRADGGLFQQEHDDPRYLPFERRGVISSWQLSLEGVYDTFDRRTIPDVVLHVCYTARDGGELLKSGAIASIEAALEAQVTGLTDATGPLTLLSARHDLPDAFNAFLYPSEAGSAQTLTLELDTTRFPFAFRGQQIAIDRLAIFLLPVAGAVWSDAQPLALSLLPQAGAEPAVDLLMAGSLVDGVPMAMFDYGSAKQPPGTFTLTASEAAIAEVAEPFKAGDSLNPAAIEDLLVVVHYAVTRS